ncbi:lactonase family protein [Nocardia sp. NPDC127579]|uniref:lactonase family protein n=1 Tax=Nocardia sp. NPDC127579 TaxID=3345402 RepID=UPI0036256A9B
MRDRAYFGSYTTGAAGGRGIATASIDPGTGSPVIDDIVAVADPSYLAISADRRCLYAVNEGAGPGSVTAVDLRADPPVVLNSVAVQGIGPTHLCLSPDGRHVLTANYMSGSVSVVAVHEDGRLGALTDVVPHHGAGPDPDRQAGPHVHQVLIDPSGHWVVVVDLGVDAVYVYRLVDGTLHQHARVAMTPGSGPRHLVWHPDGRRAFLANELNSTVTVCEWRAETGELRPGKSIPTDAADHGAPSEPVLAHDGRRLYLASRGPDTIVTFEITGDELTQVHSVPCGGALPRDLHLAPDGTRLYVANQTSGTVTWLDLDPVTGLPAAPSGALDFPAATAVLFSE